MDARKYREMDGEGRGGMNNPAHNKHQAEARLGRAGQDRQQASWWERGEEGGWNKRNERRNVKGRTGGLMDGWMDGWMNGGKRNN